MDAMKWLGAFARRPKPGHGSHGLHTPHADTESLWFEWLALGGLLLFGTWLLGVRGVWGLLLQSDPTGLTLVILWWSIGSKQHPPQRQPNQQPPYSNI